jgi:hypothetical protein
LWSRGRRFLKHPRLSHGSDGLELASAAFSIHRGMARIPRTFLDNGGLPQIGPCIVGGNDQAADIPKDTALHALLRSALYKYHRTSSEAEVLNVCKMLFVHGAAVNQIANGETRSYLFQPGALWSTKPSCWGPCSDGMRIRAPNCRCSLNRALKWNWMSFKEVRRSRETDITFTGY